MVDGNAIIFGPNLHALLHVEHVIFPVLACFEQGPDDGDVFHYGDAAVALDGCNIIL